MLPWIEADSALDKGAAKIQYQQLGPRTSAMPKCHFKTIYFPRERTRSGSSARVTISLPVGCGPAGLSEDVLKHILSMNSREFRLTLGDPFLEDLEQSSTREGRSFSNTCLQLFSQRVGHNGRHRPAGNGAQMQLPFSPETFEDLRPDVQSFPLGVTFRESRHQGAHGWYPYVEGFSATYVRDALLRFEKTPRAVYDPFGGSGTTQLTASLLGIRSFYSEVNPFMSFVAETKVNSSSWAVRNFSSFRNSATDFLAALDNSSLDKRGARLSLAPYNSAFPNRDFFEDCHLRRLLAARECALEITAEQTHIRNLLLLACAANVVHSSHMTRRADLRRRRNDEYKTRVVDVAKLVSAAVERMLEDLSKLPPELPATQKVSEDARELDTQYSNAFDFAITSPPYLNGTNYFRNTKLELWYLNFIASESELSSHCQKAISAGINNVSKSRPVGFAFPFVEDAVATLEKCAGDQRIPLMVRQYFSDMYQVLQVVHRSLVPGCRFLLDIGDSKFYGVHVPTHTFLERLARQVGFEIESSHVLARRHSRDKSELVQVEYVFRKPTTQLVVGTPKNVDGIVERIEHFRQQLPYKKPPYNSRSWGHCLHSLCSYQGKFKPSLAHWLVREFVPEGARVLDPLGGVGTIALEAALQGHEAVTNDKSPLAGIVAAGKVNPPPLEIARAAIETLDTKMRTVALSAADIAAANFGLNATVADYYHERTLEEILKARKILLRDGPGGPAESFIWASLLHVLHGNRPYALSRVSHPITPLNPKGEFQYRSLVQKVRDRVERALQEPLPERFRAGRSHTGDFRELAAIYPEHFQVVITSPPFLGMRFDRPNWLRLWFCGWNEGDFHKTSLGFLERQQTRSSECYKDLFETAATCLSPAGLFIMHVGSGGRRNLAEELKALSAHRFKLINDVVENVQAIEQHGLSDKGLTTTHHLMIMQKAPIAP